MFKISLQSPGTLILNPLKLRLIPIRKSILKYKTSGLYSRGYGVPIILNNSCYFLTPHSLIVDIKFTKPYLLAQTFGMPLPPYPLSTQSVKAHLINFNKINTSGYKDFKHVTLKNNSLPYHASNHNTMLLKSIIKEIKRCNRLLKQYSA